MPIWSNPPPTSEVLLWFTIDFSRPLPSVTSLIAQLVKNSPAVSIDPGSIPGSGRSPAEGKGFPLQSSGLENSMDSVVRGVAKSQTRLSDFHFQWTKQSSEPFFLVPSCLAISFLPQPSHELFTLAIMRNFPFPNAPALLHVSSVYPPFPPLCPRMPFPRVPASLFTWFILSFLLVL